MREVRRIASRDDKVPWGQRSKVSGRPAYPAPKWFETGADCRPRVPDHSATPRAGVRWGRCRAPAIAGLKPNARNHINSP